MPGIVVRSSASLNGGRGNNRYTNPPLKENPMTHIPIAPRRAMKLAAIAVAVACLATIPSYAQEQQQRPQDRQQQGDRIGQPGAAHQDLPPGIRWDTEAADPGDFRGVIDDVTGAAVIENGFNDVVERFVDQDRNRFGEWMDQGENREFTEFNAAAKRFQEAYKGKFGGEFDFD